jgi:hypothetical protein
VSLEGGEVVPFLEDHHFVEPELGLIGQIGLSINGGTVLDTSFFGSHIGDDFSKFTEELVTGSWLQIDGRDDKNHDALLYISELKYNAGSHRSQSSNPTRADFLDAVVSVYELLEADERREAVLRIGRGPTLPYSRAFCRVEHYFSARGERIFHGGVRVRSHGRNFAVRFFDRVAAPNETKAGKVVDVSLYLKRQIVLDHWNGKFLVAQLSEAAKPGNYAHCNFFGRIEPHPAESARLIAVVDSLDYLAFTVRRKVAGLTDGSK